MNPRFSVVIPAFNAESTVTETVRAAVTQPLPRDAFECLVVDDGSRDRTAEIAEHAGAVVVRLPGNTARPPRAMRGSNAPAASGSLLPTRTAFLRADGCRLCLPPPKPPAAQRSRWPAKPSAWIPKRPRRVSWTSSARSTRKLTCATK